MKRLVKCIRGSRSLFNGNGCFTAGKVYEVVVYDYCFTTKMHCLLIDDRGLEMWAEDDRFEAINFDMETGN